VATDSSSKANTFKAHLAPAVDSKYAYTIINESSTEIEVNGNTVNTLRVFLTGFKFRL
jgi:hypothetical protein